MLVEVGGVRSASTVARAARRLVVAGTPTRREQAGCAVTKRSDATTDLDIGDLRGSEPMGLFWGDSRHIMSEADARWSHPTRREGLL